MSKLVLLHYAHRKQTGLDPWPMELVQIQDEEKK